MKYLWCSYCEYVSAKTSWKSHGAKYGVCPRCGRSEYNNALEWAILVRINDYPETPDPHSTYSLYPVLF